MIPRKGSDLRRKKGFKVLDRKEIKQDVELREAPGFGTQSGFGERLDFQETEGH